MRSRAAASCSCATASSAIAHRLPRVRHQPHVPDEGAREPGPRRQVLRDRGSRSRSEARTPEVLLVRRRRPSGRRLLLLPRRRARWLFFGASDSTSAIAFSSFGNRPTFARRRGSGTQRGSRANTRRNTCAPAPPACSRTSCIADQNCSSTTSARASSPRRNGRGFGRLALARVRVALVLDPVRARSCSRRRISTSGARMVPTRRFTTTSFHGLPLAVPFTTRIAHDVARGCRRPAPRRRRARRACAPRDRPSRSRTPLHRGPHGRLAMRFAWQLKLSPCTSPASGMYSVRSTPPRCRASTIGDLPAVRSGSPRSSESSACFAVKPFAHELRVPSDRSPRARAIASRRRRRRTPPTATVGRPRSSGLHRDAELAGHGIARDDRVRARAVPAVPRSVTTASAGAAGAASAKDSATSANRRRTDRLGGSQAADARSMGRRASWARRTAKDLSALVRRISARARTRA